MGSRFLNNNFVTLIDTCVKKKFEFHSLKINLPHIKVCPPYYQPFIVLVKMYVIHKG